MQILNRINNVMRKYFINSNYHAHAIIAGIFLRSMHPGNLSLRERSLKNRVNSHSYLNNSSDSGEISAIPKFDDPCIVEKMNFLIHLIQSPLYAEYL